MLTKSGTVVGGSFRPLGTRLLGMVQKSFGRAVTHSIELQEAGPRIMAPRPRQRDLYQPCYSAETLTEMLLNKTHIGGFVVLGVVLIVLESQCLKTKFLMRMTPAV